MTQKNVFEDPFDYAEMVESLFKKADKWEEMLIHATVGITGEAIELYAADHDWNVENCKEELGDMVFYIYKVLSLLGITEESAPTDEVNADLVVEYGVADENRFPHIIDRIVYRSGELLDLSKKIWVYEDQSKKAELTACLYTLIGHVVAYTIENPSLGTLDAIRQGNRAKLHKRYPQGAFSNKDAQERKDKV